MYQVKLVLLRLLRLIGFRKGTEKVVRSWRIIGSEASGYYCYFDPKFEKIMIKELTLSEQCSNLENVISVSGSVEGETFVRVQRELKFPEGVPFGI